MATGDPTSRESKGIIEKKELYSAFDVIVIFNFSFDERHATDFFTRVLDRIVIALKYTKEVHRYILVKLIKGKISQDKALSSLFECKSAKNDLNRILTDVKKETCECTAFEAFSFMPKLDVNPSKVDMRNFIETFKQTVGLIKKSHIKLAYHLAKVYTGPNQSVWEAVQDGCKSTALLYLESGVNLQKFSFEEHERISLFEALTLVPMVYFGCKRDVEYFLSSANTAVACLKSSYLSYLYDLLKFRFSPPELDEQCIHLYEFHAIITKLYEQNPKIPTTVFWPTLDPRESVPMSEIVKILKNTENMENILGILNFLFYTIRMVHDNDLNFLYTLIMDRLIAHDRRYRKYYVEDISKFKDKMKEMVWAEVSNCSGYIPAQLHAVIDKFPNVNKSHVVKYPAIVAADLVPTITEVFDDNHLVVVANGIKHALKFVYPDEMDLLNILVQCNIKDEIMPLIQKENTCMIDYELWDIQSMVRYGTIKN